MKSVAHNSAAMLCTFLQWYKLTMLAQVSNLKGHVIYHFALLNFAPTHIQLSAGTKCMPSVLDSAQHVAKLLATCLPSGVPVQSAVGKRN